MHRSKSEAFEPGSPRATAAAPAPISVFRRVTEAENAIRHCLDSALEQAIQLSLEKTLLQGVREDVLGVLSDVVSYVPSDGSVDDDKRSASSDLGELRRYIAELKHLIKCCQRQIQMHEDAYNTLFRKYNSKDRVINYIRETLYKEVIKLKELLAQRSGEQLELPFDPFDVLLLLDTESEEQAEQLQMLVEKQQRAWHFEKSQIEHHFKSILHAKDKELIVKTQEFRKLLGQEANKTTDVVKPALHIGGPRAAQIEAEVAHRVKEALDNERAQLAEEIKSLQRQILEDELKIRLQEDTIERLKAMNGQQAWLSSPLLTGAHSDTGETPSLALTRKVERHLLIEYLQFIADLKEEHGKEAEKLGRELQAERHAHHMILMELDTLHDEVHITRDEAHVAAQINQHEKQRSESLRLEVERHKEEVASKEVLIERLKSELFTDPDKRHTAELQEEIAELTTQLQMISTRYAVLERSAAELRVETNHLRTQLEATERICEARADECTKLETYVHTLEDSVRSSVTQLAAQAESKSGNKGNDEAEQAPRSANKRPQDRSPPVEKNRRSAELESELERLSLMANLLAAENSDLSSRLGNFENKKQVDGAAQTTEPELHSSSVSPLSDDVSVHKSAGADFSIVALRWMNAHLRARLDEFSSSQQLPQPPQSPPPQLPQVDFSDELEALRSNNAWLQEELYRLAQLQSPQEERGSLSPSPLPFPTFPTVRTPTPTLPSSRPPSVVHRATSTADLVRFSPDPFTPPSSAGFGGILGAWPSAPPSPVPVPVLPGSGSPGSRALTPPMTFVIPSVSHTDTQPKPAPSQHPFWRNSGLMAGTLAPPPADSPAGEQLRYERSVAESLGLHGCPTYARALGWQLPPQRNPATGVPTASPGKIRPKPARNATGKDSDEPHIPRTAVEDAALRRQWEERALGFRQLPIFERLYQRAALILERLALLRARMRQGQSHFLERSYWTMLDRSASQQTKAVEEATESAAVLNTVLDATNTRRQKPEPEGKPVSRPPSRATPAQGGVPRPTVTVRMFPAPPSTLVLVPAPRNTPPSRPLSTLSATPGPSPEMSPSPPALPDYDVRATSRQALQRPQSSGSYCNRKMATGTSSLETLPIKQFNFSNPIPVPAAEIIYGPIKPATPDSGEIPAGVIDGLLGAPETEETGEAVANAAASFTSPSPALRTELELRASLREEMLAHPERRTGEGTKRSAGKAPGFTPRPASAPTRKRQLGPGDGYNTLTIGSYPDMHSLEEIPHVSGFAFGSAAPRVGGQVYKGRPYHR
eukprot:TRINITY_DN15743_c0_g1_i1.p1 TRINITY_DN15743_c0_g1~~TRINITY_DN15743_c0_g1_i1.p1  ORF type:complete len:1282 (-),score=223.95 TRINITY_DN15743_c0_g1_i1:36-3881(-)